MFTYEVRGKSDNELCTAWNDEFQLNDTQAAEKALPLLLKQGYFGGTFTVTKTMHNRLLGSFDFYLQGALPLRAVLHERLNEHDRLCLDVRY